jgi:hypothetical protein
VDRDGRDYELLIGGPYKDHPYGHAALRVYGQGYDVTYDFGRYGRTWGIGNSKGEGILRAWTSFSAYVQGENATGRKTEGFVFTTTAEQDRKAMDYFQTLIASGKERSSDKNMTSYRLSTDYDAASINCTTLSIAGAGQGVPELGKALADVSESKGRGLSWVEKKLAPLGERIFMPEDLKANVLRQQPTTKRVYEAPPGDKPQ